MEINVTESKAVPSKAYKLALTAECSEDMEFLTALAAALIQKRRVIVTNDPNGKQALQLLVDDAQELQLGY